MDIEPCLEITAYQQQYTTLVYKNMLNFQLIHLKHRQNKAKLSDLSFVFHQISDI